MKYIHISSQVEGRIEILKRSGKTGKVATQKVLLIIESLESGTVGNHMNAIGSFTQLATSSWNLWIK